MGLYGCYGGGGGRGRSKCVGLWIVACNQDLRIISFFIFVSASKVLGATDQLIISNNIICLCIKMVTTVYTNLYNITYI